MNAKQLLSILGLLAIGIGLLVPLPQTNALVPLNIVLALAGALALIPGLSPSQIRNYRTRAAVHIAARRAHHSASKGHGVSAGNYRSLPPMFKYFGGKSRFAHKIVRRIPEHKTFVEPFAGGASVTLAKPPSPREVLSDKRADVIGFYRAVKRGSRIGRIPPATKKAVKRIIAKPERLRTPAELYRLQGSTFGGHGLSFANAQGPGSGKMFNLRFPFYNERLKRITLLNQDYRTTIRQFDSPRTAYYVDPPYPEDRQQYTHYAGKRPIPTVQEVKSAVQNVKGKVILSYPNIPSVRNAFTPPHWHTERLRVLNAMYGTTGRARTRTELLITNFRPEGVKG